MRYIGLDYGDKRIGVALSDSEGRVAFPRQMVFNRGFRTALDLKKIIEKEGVSKIIIGLPLNANGGENEQSGKVRKFANLLSREVFISVEFENELLTTHLVERIPGIKKEHTDEAAAALILQSFLDKLNRPFAQ